MLAPSVRLVRSSWPIIDIWAHAISGTAMPQVPIAHHALVLRKDFDPEPFSLSDTEATFIEHILRGNTLAVALDAAPQLDFARLLTLLMQNHALCEIKME